jgi:hypothetical protein
MSTGLGRFTRRPVPPGPVPGPAGPLRRPSLWRTMSGTRTGCPVASRGGASTVEPHVVPQVPCLTWSCAMPHVVVPQRVVVRYFAHYFAHLRDMRCNPLISQQILNIWREWRGFRGAHWRHSLGAPPRPPVWWLQWPRTGLRAGRTIPHARFPQFPPPHRRRRPQGPEFGLFGGGAARVGSGRAIYGPGWGGGELGGS